MFRRLPSSLPKDYRYPADLTKLGLCITEEDEIRQIEEPDAYFNRFTMKDAERQMNMHQAAFQAAVKDIIHDRLVALHLDKIFLPLDSKEGEPRIPIFVSEDLRSKSIVVILFYEHNQELGVLAQRIINCRGGINKGSAVNFVKAIQALRLSDGSTPGVILANMGELRWWRRGKRAVSHFGWQTIPQKSAVEKDVPFDEIKNVVPGNRDTKEHFSFMFNEVIPQLTNPHAQLSIITVSDSCGQAVEFFKDTKNWDRWSSRISSLALLGPVHRAEELSTSPKFAAWLRQRGRAFVVSEDESGVPVVAADEVGCTVYNLGVLDTELLLPERYQVVLDWIMETV